MTLSTTFVTALALASFASAHKSCKPKHNTYANKGNTYSSPKTGGNSYKPQGNTYNTDKTSPDSNPNTGYTPKTPSGASHYAGSEGYHNPSGDYSHWQLKTSATGSQIYDYFKFETDSPSSQGGVARYVDRQTAGDAGMLGVDDGTAYFGVDTGGAYQGGRRSLRCSSTDIYNAGTMFVVDIAHMPTGCGTWPALWTVAQDGDWPGKGELDIVEAVNDFNANALSAHTKDGYQMQAQGFTSNFMLTDAQKTQCSVYKTDNQGCGLRDPDLSSAGAGFNAAGGGTWVMKWDDEEIAMWMFPHGQEPEDLQSGSPTPSSDWGTPRALYRGASGQKTSDFFQDHVLVLNTNLCGQWPEGVWNDADKSAGQDQSCAAKTGSSSCSALVQGNGDAFKSAYWAIRSLKVYTQ